MKAKEKYIAMIIAIFILIIMINMSLLFSISNYNAVAEGTYSQDLDNNKITDYSDLDYSGIYYLHDDLPEHGQDIGNTHDVGDLLRIQPHGNEERYCAKWVQFDFDEHVFGELTGDESYMINNIYYHIWWKSANERASIGVEVHGTYDSHTDYSFSTSHDETVSTVEKNGYWLTVGFQKVGFFQEDIHNMAVKVVSIDAIPSVYSGVDQYSFIILNLDDDEILKTIDKDNDGLRDYDELFTYFTNPEDSDTDNDGLDDFEEVQKGKDQIITDPNNFDIDNDDILDGKDTEPLTTQYRIIKNEWVVKGKEVVRNDGLLLRSNLIVKKGGKLTLDNVILKMNQEGQQNRIRVENGGELEILNSDLVTDDPGHWYSMTLQTEHWHEHRTFEIYGKATIQNNIIDYGGMIYIRDTNNTIIKGNEISHYYYGIFCSHASPKLYENTILPFVGNGIFLWYSSPEITSTIIRTYIGTGVSCYYSSPIIIDCEISGGSNDFYLSCNSHPVVSNTEFNRSMVHIDDANSTLMVGSFDKDSKTNDDNGSESWARSKIYPELMVAGLIIFGIFLACYLLKGKFDYTIQLSLMEYNKKDSDVKRRRKGKKGRNGKNGRKGRKGKKNRKRRKM